MTCDLILFLSFGLTLTCHFLKKYYGIATWSFSARKTTLLSFEQVYEIKSQLVGFTMRGSLRSLGKYSGNINLASWFDQVCLGLYTVRAQARAAPRQSPPHLER